jgi:hypothetical protein
MTEPSQPEKDGVLPSDPRAVLNSEDANDIAAAKAALSEPGSDDLESFAQDPGL